jgi:hypothetical protein
MKLDRVIFTSIACVLLAGAAQAKDSFESVKCGGDVRSAILGRHMSDEPVVQIEKRHSDLGLKDLGGDEITDTLNSTSWRICGKEYVLTLDSHGTVRDVLAFPPHSATAPQFSGMCRTNGKAMPGTMIGVLDNNTAKGAVHYSAQDETLLPATAAWKINSKTGEFNAVPTAGLSCPRSAIITEDGGP